MTETQTPEQVRQQGEAALDLLRSFSYASEFTIDDYPLGKDDRGRCKVEAEYRAGHGYRLVRTTENPSTGDWYKPHKSQYHIGITLPAHDLCRELQRLHPEFVGDKTFTGWVQYTMSGLHLRRADYSSLVLLDAPNRGYPPRREPKVLESTTLGADTPELIAAWDAYEPVRNQILEFLKSARQEVKQRAVSPVTSS